MKNTKIKTWLITGSTSGIGKELCSILLNRGYNVVSASIEPSQIKHQNLFHQITDVRDLQQIDSVIKAGIERFGSIDVLVNNAGIFTEKFLEDENYESIQPIIDTNFYGYFHMIKSMIPYFREQGHGIIINNSSALGLCSYTGHLAYGVSKRCVEALSDTARLEYSDFCNVLTVEMGYFNHTKLRTIVKETKRAIKSKEEQNNNMNKQNRNKISIKQTINCHNKTYNKYKQPRYLCSSLTYDKDISSACNLIIDTIQSGKIPRRLILGSDSYYQIKSEISNIQRDIRRSHKYIKRIHHYKLFSLRVRATYFYNCLRHNL